MLMKNHSKSDLSACEYKSTKIIILSYHIRFAQLILILSWVNYLMHLLCCKEENEDVSRARKKAARKLQREEGRENGGPFSFRGNSSRDCRGGEKGGRRDDVRLHSSLARSLLNGPTTCQRMQSFAPHFHRNLSGPQRALESGLEIAQHVHFEQPPDAYSLSFWAASAARC